MSFLLLLLLNILCQDRLIWHSGQNQIVFWIFTSIANFIWYYFSTDADCIGGRVSNVINNDACGWNIKIAIGHNSDLHTHEQLFFSFILLLLFILFACSANSNRLSYVLACVFICRFLYFLLHLRWELWNSSHTPTQHKTTHCTVS